MDKERIYVSVPKFRHSEIPTTFVTESMKGFMEGVAEEILVEFYPVDHLSKAFWRRHWRVIRGGLDEGGGTK